MAWHLAHRCLLLEAAVALTCACAELPAVARERVGGGAVDEAGGAVEEEADSPDWESLSSFCAHSRLSALERWRRGFGQGDRRGLLPIG